MPRQALASTSTQPEAPEGFPWDPQPQDSSATASAAQRSTEGHPAPPRVHSRGQRTPGLHSPGFRLFCWSGEHCPSASAGTWLQDPTNARSEVARAPPVTWLSTRVLTSPAPAGSASHTHNFSPKSFQLEVVPILARGARGCESQPSVNPARTALCYSRPCGTAGDTRSHATRADWEQRPGHTALRETCWVKGIAASGLASAKPKQRGRGGQISRMLQELDSTSEDGDSAAWSHSQCLL